LRMSCGPAVSLAPGCLAFAVLLPQSATRSRASSKKAPAAASFLAWPFVARYDRTNMPNTRQISALPVAMKKSSVPRGEKSSSAVLDTEITIASAIQAGGSP
jgi:hypothetical protein